MDPAFAIVHYRSLKFLHDTHVFDNVSKGINRYAQTIRVGVTYASDESRFSILPTSRDSLTVLF